ncbi:MAG: hypothetical protein ACLRSW_17410, partial [Christensenellaceae bacterium]
ADAEKLKQAAERAVGEYGKVPDGVPMYAIGGTATTLAALSLDMREYDSSRVTGTIVTAAQMRALAERLTKMRAEDVAKLPGVQPKRADVLGGGAVLLSVVMDRLGFSELIVSDSGNLEGYAKKRGFIGERMGRIGGKIYAIADALMAAENVWSSFAWTKAGTGVAATAYAIGGFLWRLSLLRPYTSSAISFLQRRGMRVVMTRFSFFLFGRKTENALSFFPFGGSDADNSPPRRKYEKAGRALHRRGTYIRGDLFGCFARRGVFREVGIGKRRFFVLGRRALCRLSLFLKSSALPLRKRADGYGGAAIDRE